LRFLSRLFCEGLPGGELVRAKGLEPPHLAILVPKTSASTNSATPADPNEAARYTERVHRVEGAPLMPLPAKGKAIDDEGVDVRHDRGDEPRNECHGAGVFRDERIAQMSRYDTPKVPPATPPVVNRDADPEDTLDRADADGDSGCDGSRTSRHERDMSEIAKERAGTLAERDKRDGLGEAALDQLPPD
jgi:hypothetical protein